MTRFRCPACGHAVRSNRPIPEGTRVRCPFCRAALAAPAPAPVEELQPIFEDDEPAPAPVEAEVVDEPPPRRRRQPPRSHRPGVPVWVWAVFGVVVFALIGGGVALNYAYNRADETPLFRAAFGVRGLSEASLKQLKVGMTDAEVLALLGKPNADRTEPNAKLILGGPAGKGPVTKRVLMWVGNGGGLTAEFHDGQLAMAVGQVGEYRHAVQWTPPEWQRR